MKIKVSYIVWAIAAMLVAKSCLANGANADLGDWLCGTAHLASAHKPKSPQAMTANLNSLRSAPPRLDRAGEQRNFYVHIPTHRVTATCARVGKHAYVYVDNSKIFLLTDADLDYIITEFDNRIYPKTRELFGSEWKPGIDRDAKITILLHDVGNNGSSKGFGGYFEPSDEDPAYVYSNMREIVYIDVYYPKERDRWTFQATLAHEFTHMINWSVNGQKSEESWLDEGLASFSEWSIYQYIHLIYVDGFFKNSDLVSLTDSSLPENRYGASFLILLYLYEKYGGKSMISRISSSKFNGIWSIKESLKAGGYKDSFEDVFNVWVLANFFNDISFNDQLGYRNISTNRKVQAKAENVFDSYPARGDRSLREWSVEYLEFRSPPADFKVAFETKSGGGFAPLILKFSDGQPPEISKFALNANGNGVYHAGDVKTGETLVLATISTLNGSYGFQAGKTVDDNFKLNQDLPFFREIIESGAFGKELTSHWSVGSKLMPGGLLSTGLKMAHFGDVRLSGKNGGIFAAKDKLFVASGWGLEAFSILADGTLKKVGEVPISGFAEDVSVKGKYAYVAAGRSGVQVVDVSDLDNLRIAGSYQPTEYAHIVETSESSDCAYLVDLRFGLKVLDLQNPVRPSLIASYETKGIALSAHLSGAYAYFSDTEKGLSIFDISDPRRLTLVGQYKEGQAYGIHVSGRYAYLAGGDLEVVDVSNPKSPRKSASIRVSGLANRVYIQGNMALISDAKGAFRVLDLSDLNRPKNIAEVKWDGSSAGMAINNEFVYLSDEESGLKVISVLDLFKPRLAQVYRNNGVAFGLTFLNGYLYVADGHGGLKIVDVRDPSRSTLIGGQWLGGLVANVASKGDYVYLALGDEGMKIVDVSTPSEPKIAGELKGIGDVVGVEVRGDYAYLAAASLLIVDISVPTKPFLVSTLELPGYAHRIKAGTSLDLPLLVYVAALDGGLQVVDVSDPKWPKVIGSYLGSGDVWSVDFDSGRLYIADNRDGFLILDVSDPKLPELVGSYPTGDEISDIKVRGKHALIVSLRSLRLLDLSDPKSPKLSAEINGLKWASAAVFDKNLNFAYVADLYQLRAFKLDVPKTALAVDPSLEKSSISILGKTQFWLAQNFPNPANPETWIPFELAEGSRVIIEIYEVGGGLVKRLDLGEMRGGSYLDRSRAAHWDGKNKFGEPVSSGIYFYLLKAGEFSAIRKLQVIK